MKALQDYLWKGLNLKDFAVVAIWPQNRKEGVILMRERGAPPEKYPWCVEYRGSGHYFQTIGEAVEYCEKRKFIQEVPV